MDQPTTTASPLPVTLGLDLGLRRTQVCAIDSSGAIIEERAVATSRDAISELLERFPKSRIVLEASTSARWITALAESSGHEVIVANPRNIPVVTANVRKCDRNDARLLAELGQVKPQLLSPVQLRSDRHQRVRTLLFARSQLVKQRTALTNLVRAEVRVLGFSLPSGAAKSFAEKMWPRIPGALRSSLGPIFEVLRTVTTQIDHYDAEVERLSETEFPETAVLRQVHGVGPLIALAFVATIGDPERFKKSRSVGAYLGLVPRMSQSGARNPTLSITKCGDHFMRSLLVSAATRILGPFGQDSDLLRHGERIATGGDKRAKAKARIAVARRLAVLLHRLLCTGEQYDPLRQAAPAA